ncbi:4'-phosphopantetheinyl transferase superfamily protein [Sinomicrobium pectinilyticum]|uniref:4'-phosphopantetheinyl transferase superfamily protein n=1 Tax=Sinomicrobium pectinilyticum TaxID=1084421 RepID=A0A3N0E2B3_SINP1|nr:4'-phosphopantetheinyl transferase superfamily protein [Sinomicrobium pectinilyticum]RNL81987.1 4'-phosphopantetheinyl transferase superfamily protein [Sinomicrobium pectinilyticum]
MDLINIFVTSFKKPLEQDLFSGYLSYLSPDLKQRNSRYIRWQDKHSHLFGKLLLMEALRIYGIETDIWNYLAYNDYQRPYLTLDGYDFNISHSGNFVICAFGKNIRLGIDIEENRRINIEDFGNIMSPGQWHEINESDYPLKEFYKYWTIKESVMKADGRGFSIPPDKLEMNNNTVQYEDKLWFVHQLTVDSDYSAALATNRLSAFKIRYIDFYKSRTLT